MCVYGIILWKCRDLPIPTTWRQGLGGSIEWVKEAHLLGGDILLSDYQKCLKSAVGQTVLLQIVLLQIEM